MAVNYIYSDQTGPSLPGGGRLFFRTVTEYTKDSSGKVTDSTIQVYYTSIPGGRASNGDDWTPGSSTSLDSFNPGGFTKAATSRDGGKTFTTLSYTQEDADAGRIPSGKKVGDSILGATAIQSLTTRNGILNKSIQNSVINTAVKTEPGLAKQLTVNLQNTGPNNPNGTNPSGTNPTEESSEPRFTQQESFKSIEYRDVRTSYANLSYPLNRNVKQDHIQFSMLEYVPRKFSGNVLDNLGSKSFDQALGTEIIGTREEFKKDRKSIGTVSLPISSPISDTNSVSWNDDSMSAFTALSAGVYRNAVSGPDPQTPQTPPPTTPGTGNSQTKTLVMNALTKAAMGGGGGANLLTRTTGAIINQNLELLFNGPSLRTFSFTFPLLARSEKESEVILQIIRFFKQGMSVKRSTSALFLKSPHTFKIKYVPARTDENQDKKNHRWINKIKECALTSCSVNYTPSGNYATYANGAMTMYEMTLNFSELEPIFDDDYAVGKLGNNDGNAPGKDTMIGY